MKSRRNSRTGKATLQKEFRPCFEGDDHQTSYLSIPVSPGPGTELHDIPYSCIPSLSTYSELDPC